MPSRDMNSITREMKKCIDYAAQWFKENDIPLDAPSVTALALAMFNDHRNNTPRDVAATEANTVQALLNRITVKLKLRK